MDCDSQGQRLEVFKGVWMVGLTLVLGKDKTEAKQETIREPISKPGGATRSQELHAGRSGIVPGRVFWS